MDLPAPAQATRDDWSDYAPVDASISGNGYWLAVVAGRLPGGTCRLYVLDLRSGAVAFRFEHPDLGIRVKWIGRDRLAFVQQDSTTSEGRPRYHAYLVSAANWDRVTRLTKAAVELPRLPQQFEPSSREIAQREAAARRLNEQRLKPPTGPHDFGIWGYRFVDGRYAEVSPDGRLIAAAIDPKDMEKESRLVLLRKRKVWETEYLPERRHSWGVRLWRGCVVAGVYDEQGVRTVRLFDVSDLRRSFEVRGDFFVRRD
jgi:hypothetical protein